MWRLRYCNYIKIQFMHVPSLLVTLCFISTVASSQTISRLTSVQVDFDHHAFDSSYFSYNPGNSSAGDGRDYMRGTLKCDTGLKFFFQNGSYNTFYKFGYGYSQSGKLLTYNSWEANPHGSNNWVNGGKVSYTYDVNDNLVQSENMMWDTTANNWYLNDRETYLYNGNLLTEHLHEYFTGLLLSAQGHYIYTYSGDTVFELQVTWTNNTNVWDTVGRTITVYDANQNITYSEMDLWQSGFVPDQRSLYSNNVAGQPVYKLQQVWAAPTWENHWQESYTYNAAGSRLSHYEDGWNTTTSTWQHQQKDTNLYDVNNNTVDSVLSVWDNSLQGYKNAEKYSFTYNNFNQPLTQGLQWWDNVSNAWVDGSGDYYYRYFYSLTNLEVTGPKGVGGNIALFPCPAHDFITLQLRLDKASSFTITICDAQGRRLKQWNKSATDQYVETISLKGLEPGNYLLSVNTRTSKFSQIFSVLR